MVRQLSSLIEPAAALAILVGVWMIANSPSSVPFEPGGYYPPADPAFFGQLYARYESESLSR